MHTTNYKTMRDWAKWEMSGNIWKWKNRLLNNNNKRLSFVCFLFLSSFINFVFIFATISLHFSSSWRIITINKTIKWTILSFRYFDFSPSFVFRSLHFIVWNQSNHSNQCVLLYSIITQHECDAFFHLFELFCCFWLLLPTSILFSSFFLSIIVNLFVNCFRL